VINNVIRRSWSDGISLMGVSMFDVSGNIVEDGQDVGITLDLDCSDGRVTRNIVRHAGTQGLWIQGRRIHVTDNSVLDSHCNPSNDDNVTPVADIFIYNCSHCVVMSNSVCRSKIGGSVLDCWGIALYGRQKENVITSNISTDHNTFAEILVDCQDEGSLMDHNVGAIHRGRPPGKGRRRDRHRSQSTR
jgi:nitrous oxidase accessory protein NosD